MIAFWNAGRWFLLLYMYASICLVPVWRFLSPSRSIHFSDVSEANGQETSRQKQNVQALVAF